MGDERQLPKQETPPASRPPVGAPAPPVTDVPVKPDLRSQDVLRSGAIVMAVLWEE